MLQVLDALAAWRRSVITGLSVTHALSSDAASVALPASTLAARPLGQFVMPVCVDLEVTETVSVEAQGSEEHAALTAIVASLRALSGKARLASTDAARIHSHVLVSEVPGKDENQRRQSVLTWKVVASWA